MCLPCSWALQLWSLRSSVTADAQSRVPAKNGQNGADRGGGGREALPAWTTRRRREKNQAGKEALRVGSMGEALAAP